MSSFFIIPKTQNLIFANGSIISRGPLSLTYFYSRKGYNRLPQQKSYHPVPSDTELYPFAGKQSIYSRSPSVYANIPCPLHSPFILNQSHKTLYKSIGVANHRIPVHDVCRSLAYFHTTPNIWKEESKVEKTVKALKDKVKETEDAKATAQSDVVATDEETTVVPTKKSIPQRLSAAVKHYYHGFRLLFIDMKICSRLIWRIMNGQTLSRREHKQLVRTTADMFRLLPMLVFVLVPFAEFLLPVVLTLFPNMLPSTFTEEKTEKEKVKKNLKAKIEMAKFLQETLKETAVMAKKHDGQTESFASFLDQIRDQGIKPKTKDIMRFAKLFEDEITLDNLNRQQLRACCIMLGITPIGSDALLRFLLQMKLRRLLADDKMIQKEGIESLTISELQAANRARGMRALGVSEERLREQLKQWMLLHLDNRIPTSLLLLSRALYLSDNLSTEEKITVTITQLADTATNEAKVKVAEMSGEQVDNKAKLDIIQHEEQIIATEKEQMAMELRVQLESQRDQAEAKAAEVVMESLDVKDATRPQHMQTPPDLLVDKAKVLEASAAEEFKEEASMSSKDFSEMEDVLEKIAEVKKIAVEKDALKGLKTEVDEYKEDLEDLKDIAVASGKGTKEYRESKAAKRLMKKVDKMVKRLDKVVHNIQAEQTHIEENISTKEDRTQEQAVQYQQDKDQIKIYKHNIVSLNELMDALQNLKDAPSDQKLKQIFDLLDQDKDGNIDLDQALKVVELLHSEKVLLKASHIDEVIDLLRNETVIEQEEHLQEQEEKGKKQKEKAEKQKQEQQH